MPRPTKSTTLVEEPREDEPSHGSAGVMVLVGKRAITCRLHDLSVDGARLQSPLPLQVGQRLSIVLQSAGIGTSTLTADVVGVQSADLVHDLVEVRFVADSHVPAAAISEFTSAQHAARTDGDEDKDEDEDDASDHQVTMRLPRLPTAGPIDPASDPDEPKPK